MLFWFLLFSIKWTRLLLFFFFVFFFKPRNVSGSCRSLKLHLSDFLLLRFLLRCGGSTQKCWGRQLSPSNMNPYCDADHVLTIPVSQASWLSCWRPASFRFDFSSHKVFPHQQFLHSSFVLRGLCLCEYKNFANYLFIQRVFVVCLLTIRYRPTCFINSLFLEKNIRIATKSWLNTIFLFSGAGIRSVITELFISTKSSSF